MEPVRSDAWTFLQPLEDAYMTREFLKKAVQLGVDENYSSCDGGLRKHISSTILLVETVFIAFFAAISSCNDPFLLFPPIFFYSWPYATEKIAPHAFVTKQSYAVHYWAASWM